MDGDTMSMLEQRRQVGAGRAMMGGLVVATVAVCLLLVVVAQPAVAASESGEAAHHEESDTLHTVLEVSQLLVGIGGIAAAGLGVFAMRGGHMERAFYALTAGVVAFLAQRLWHSAHEFGLIFELPGTADQVLFLVATALMATGFGLVYRIMQPA